MSQVAVPDSYLDYILRRRGAEEATERAARRKANLGEATLIPDWDFREPTPYAENPTIVRGPLCSDGLHHFEATLWLVPPPPDDPKLLRNRVGQILVFVGVMASAVPLVGWVLCALLWLIAAATEGATWLANRGRVSRREGLRAAQLRDASLPWRWEVRRCGPDPWPGVVVSVEWLRRLGLRQPRRDRSDWFVVEQIEPTRHEAIAMAEHACQLLRF